MSAQTKKYSQEELEQKLSQERSKWQEQAREQIEERINQLKEGELTPLDRLLPFLKEDKP